MKVTWIPRPSPLAPTVALAWRDAGRALLRRLAATPPEHLRGAFWSEGVILEGPPSSLPWVEGIIYLGESPSAPGLYLPTTLCPTLAEPLVRDALRASHPGIRRIALSASPPMVFSLGALDTLSPERIDAVLARWGNT